MYVPVDQGFVGKIENGLGYYCYPTKRFKTINLHAVFINELTEEEAVFGAVLPHVLGRGSKKWPSMLAVEQQLDDLYGASFRAEVGKFGDKQIISFHLEVVNGKFIPGHPNTYEKGLAFLAEMIRNPMVDGQAFPKDIVEQEKELVGRQIEAIINDKGQYALSRLIEIIADGRRFGIKRLGRIDDLSGVTPQSLYQYYQTVVSRRPFVLLAVGDIDVAPLENFVETHFPPENRTPWRPIEKFTPLHNGHTVTEEQPVQQGKLNLAFATDITASDPQYPALLMYSGVLGGFPHSKLFVNVREKASLAYYAYSRIDPAIALMVIGAGIEFEDVDAAVKITREQLKSMQQGEISPEEMAFTLEAYKNEILSEEDSASQLIGRQLEGLLLGRMLMGQPLIEHLERVSVEDIKKISEHIRLDTIYFLTTSMRGGHDDAR